MIIRFESDDDSPLGKMLSILGMVIAVRSDFQENNIHSFFYVNVCINLLMNYKEYAIFVQYK